MSLEEGAAVRQKRICILSYFGLWCGHHGQSFFQPAQSVLSSLLLASPETTSMMSSRLFPFILMRPHINKEGAIDGKTFDQKSVDKLASSVPSTLYHHGTEPFLSNTKNGQLLPFTNAMNATFLSHVLLFTCALLKEGCNECDEYLSIVYGPSNKACA
eukprot:scaffold57952_cov59-Attheya_sp.AAC.1